MSGRIRAMAVAEADLGKLKDALREYERATNERIAGQGTREAVEKASRAVIDEMGVYEGHIEEQARGALRSF